MTSVSVRPISARPTVIAHRKACPSTGVGLSHYVLATKTPARKDVPTKKTVS